MSMLRTLPKKKNAVWPSPMRWLKHIHDVYNELDSTLLQRPDVIEAYNRLYDEVEKYKYGFAVDYPMKLVHYMCGIVPFRYTVQTIHTILQASGESYTENDIKLLDQEYQRMIPYYIRRYAHVYSNGTVRLAGMLHDVFSPADIMRRLDLNTLDGTPYTGDMCKVLYELTELYIELFHKVKDVIEPIILKKWADNCRTQHVAHLQIMIERKNASRIRLEEKYKTTLQEVENDLGRMYIELDKWIKKEDNE